MKRRQFLFLLMTVPQISTLFSMKKVFATNSCHKVKKLSANEIHSVTEGAVINLPSNPKNGDCVWIIVDNSSLANPAIVQQVGCEKILGNQEPLILDTLSNFKLTYSSCDNDWKLSI